MGEELRSVRELRGLTLRAVEKMTKISNAYLSQVETGKIERPSPNILYALAQAYNVPYELLMKKVGYIVKERKQNKGRNLLGAALATASDLTADEAVALAEYLAFLRSRQPRSERGE